MSERPDALRSLAAELAHAVRAARRHFSELDNARFISPLQDVLSDIGGTLQAYRHLDASRRQLRSAPSHVRPLVSLLSALASPSSPPASSSTPAPSTPPKTPLPLVSPPAPSPMLTVPASTEQPITYRELKMALSSVTRDSVAACQSISVAADTLLQHANEVHHRVLDSMATGYQDRLKEMSDAFEARLARLEARSASGSASPSVVPRPTLISTASQVPWTSSSPPPSRSRWRRAKATRVRLWWAICPDLYRRNKQEISDYGALRPDAKAYYETHCCEWDYSEIEDEEDDALDETLGDFDERF